MAKEEAAACEDYATKALAYLKKVCFAEGKPGAWATPAEMAAHMKQDKDMDPLRDRPDFQALMAELETKKGP